MILKAGDWSSWVKAMASAAVLMKLVSAGPSGSKQMVTARSSAAEKALRKGSRGHWRGPGGGDAGHDVALFGGAGDHDGAADVGAKMDEVAEVLGGALTDGGVGVIDVESFGF